ncbi:tetratricopeptide repeat protein [Algiphilus sp. W345]|uniref:Tetratricopeptide repeat protein n=1 Tax=Banduia mediterranea TaxID=3075609 RepID=A0ABU2WL16_9GAMM|nr:tetratricopeptide repeat protein [Algiphilus sp. W345]MDT0498314.1 tetratricopeptide repeat protein [Algiphilus sp. W345]
MSRTYRRGLYWPLISLLLCGLAACTTTRQPRQDWPQPRPDDPNAPVYPSWPPEPGSEGGVELPQQPAQPPVQNFPRSATEVSGPAVMALIQQAQAQRDAGNGDVAAATLDRARRIEPRNPFVWLELAKTQLAQDQAQDAEATAQRASAYSRGNPYIDQDLWQVIAAAREQLGDAGGASAARAKAGEIARMLPSS